MNLVTDSYLKKLAKPVNGISGLIPQHKINKVIVTLGAKGAMHHNILYRQINPLSTIDVSGAGDTFLAALVASYIESNNISSSITYANKVARQVVSERGVSVASKNLSFVYDFSYINLLLSIMLILFFSSALSSFNLYTLRASSMNVESNVRLFSFCLI